MDMILYARHNMTGRVLLLTMSYGWIDSWYKEERWDSYWWGSHKGRGCCAYK